LARRLEQAIHDGGRIISHRKHASIGLGFQGHPFGFKPVHGILGLKPAKRASEGFIPSRVGLNQQGGVKAGMGDVTAPTPRNPHFCQKVWPGFEEGNAAVGVRPRTGNRPKKARGTAANNNHLQGGYCLLNATTILRDGDSGRWQMPPYRKSISKKGTRVLRSNKNSHDHIPDFRLLHYYRFASTLWANSG
jgi:hypothetical protein